MEDLRHHDEKIRAERAPFPDTRDLEPSGAEVQNDMHVHMS